MKQAVILAGGKGTRLKNRLNGLPKPLIDICGMPLLERQIRLCHSYGFTDILILMNHEAARIVDFCATVDIVGMNITCIDDGEPRGTAGSVLAVLDRLDKRFLTLYGDTMLDVNLNRFWSFHDDAAAEGSLFLHPNDHPHDSDLVVVDDEQNIVAFHPYPHPDGAFEPNLVNAALYILETDALRRWANASTPLDFAKDLFPCMLEAGQCLAGYNSPEYIKDCGTPARLDKVCDDFRTGRIERASLRHRQRAVFIDRDGTINQERGYVTKPEDFELIPGVASAMHRLNGSDYRSVLVTNQPVIARGDITVKGLQAIHNKMETLLGAEKAYFDRIYYCPHHPDKGFEGEIAALKIKCDCRKPASGMVRQAAADLNIDVEKSWVIGDSTVDIRMGKDVSALTILVETGHAGRDNKSEATPDFILPNLPMAIDFILDDYPKLHSWADAFSTNINSGDMVLIGGAARCGKSTLASVLKLALKARGQEVVLLSLDRWIKSESERVETVMGRYDFDAIRLTLTAIVQRKSELTLSLPRYDKWKRQNSSNAETIVIPDMAIVIVEGTIALAFTEQLPQGRRHTLAVCTKEMIRRSRFDRYYITRGDDTAQIEALYRTRQMDEIPILNDLQKNAEHIVTLPFESDSPCL